MGKGQDLYKKAKKIIPGGTQLLSKRPEQLLPENWPSYYSKAKDCYIWDMDGRKYTDMSFMGIGANTLGYADPDINEAVKKAVDDGNMCSLNSPYEVELGNMMLKQHPWADMIRYAKGGGDAMAIAVRIARAATRKDIILFSGYHGWHDWYLSANIADSKALDGNLLPGLSPAGVVRGLKGTSYPYMYNNKTEFLSLVQKYGDNIAGVVTEGVRNFEIDTTFFATLEKETKRLGVPLIVDEVSSGYRLYSGGAHMVIGLHPDIAVFAKGMSNGYAMGAVIGKKEFMDHAQDTFISSTYWTESIGFVAAIATLKKMIEYNVPEHLVKCGKYIQDGWQRIADEHSIKVHVGSKSMYPMSHFSFDEAPLVYKTLFTQEMLKKGFLATTAYYSSYAHKQKNLDEYLQATDEVFSIIKRAMIEENPERYLDGPICQSGFKRLA